MILMKETIFKRRKLSDNYTVINNEIIKDKTLSWKAKGLLIYILHLPNDWQIHLSELQNHATDGKASFNSGWKELVKSGYVEVEQLRGESGQFGKTIITIKDSKSIGNTDFTPQAEKPSTDKPLTGKPLAENQPLLSTNSTKYLNILNTNGIGAEDSISKKHMDLIMDKWNGIEKITNIKFINKNTDRYINLNARYKELCKSKNKDEALSEILNAIENINNSDFLKGNNNRNWIISFDWFVKAGNFYKVLEGNYNNGDKHKSANGKAKKGTAAWFEQEYGNLYSN